MELFGHGRQALGAVLLLVALLCAFFWTGFFLGRQSAARTASSGPADASERVAWQANRL